MVLFQRNNFIKHLKTTIITKNFQILFNIILCLIAYVFILRAFLASDLFMDNFEHIHTSWLISTGEVPYRDFFQHHNPLLWYLFAPITQLFYRDINIIYVAQLIAIFTWAINLYLFYSIIKDYLFGKRIAQYTLLILFIHYFIWKDVQNLRPDIFMTTFFLLSLNQFFKYLKNKKLLNLTLSYFYFVISFLFLQKIAIPALGFAISNIWLLLKKELKIKETIKALLPSLLLLSGFFYILYTTNSLENWIKYNILFNMEVIDYYENFSSFTSPLKNPMYIIICSIIIYKTFQKNNQEITWCAILFPTVYSAIEFAPYPQYNTLPYLFITPYLSKFIDQIKISNTIKAFILLSLSLLSFYHLIPSENNQNYRDTYITRAKFLINNTTSNDKIINGTQNYSVNLFNKDADYFGFGYCNATKIVRLNNFAKFNWNKIVYKERPKFLLINNKETLDLIFYNNTSWLRERNQKILHSIAKYDNWKNYYIPLNLSCYNEDWDYIHQNYKWVEIKPNIGLWVRKDIKDIVY